MAPGQGGAAGSGIVLEGGTDDDADQLDAANELDAAIEFDAGPQAAPKVRSDVLFKYRSCV